MTQGDIAKLLIRFAIPLMLGNILQQLYNAFDAIIVGNYVSNEALAAVGSTGSVTGMIIAFFMGMSSGASVLVSQYYGGRDLKGISDTVHTAIAIAVISGVVLGIVGFFLAPLILTWMNSPAEVLPLASLYLKINFVGLPFLTLYNMGTGILNATGDSKRPLYFLAVTSVLHIIGNIVFVRVFNMSVEGVALSTIISQAISAVLVLATLSRSNEAYRLIFNKIRLHTYVFKRMLTIGIPSAIQSAIISISNIFVQTYINGLGGPIVAAYSASNRVDMFIQLPAVAMALSVSTFVGQNLGAGNVDRARKGFSTSMRIGLITTAAVSVLGLLFGRQALKIFTPDPELIEYGFSFMKVFVPSYFLLCFTQMIPGSLRGAGDVKWPTIITVSSFVVLRQIYLFVVTKIQYSIFTVALCYPVTWSAAAIILIFYYRRSNWDSFRKPTTESLTEVKAT